MAVKMTTYLIIYKQEHLETRRIRVKDIFKSISAYITNVDTLNQIPLVTIAIIYGNSLQLYTGVTESNVRSN